jgi:hypothetical protein
MRPQPLREAAMKSALSRAYEIAAVVAILALAVFQKTTVRNRMIADDSIAEANRAASHG